jgi:dTDP-4-dehydrorhamnose 3,5-epimerase
LRFLPADLPGAYVVEADPHEDARGLFARTFCAREFEAQGLKTSFVQCSTSWNAARGTLRGLHYQRPPAGEVKLVRCTGGSVWDVIVDLRPDSPTYRHHFGVLLSAENRRAIYIPELCAHGFQTLEDRSEVYYQMTEFYAPEFANGVRYDDPAFRIQWPLPVHILSDRDRSWPLA